MATNHHIPDSLSLFQYHLELIVILVDFKLIVDYLTQKYEHILKRIAFLL